jgi:phosphoglycolate phosphatase-like HAD superfamily hydrolase
VSTSVALCPRESAPTRESQPTHPTQQVLGSLDGRFDDKGDLIGHLMTTEQLHPADVCMVGDRKHDVQAALRHGVPTAGVLWGYGSRDELERAGAAVIIDRPGDLAP